MQYTFRGLRADQITRVFPGCIPCGCYNDDSKIYKIPRYDVNVSYDSVERNGTRMVTQIRVECDCCGASDCFDVERREVYGNQLPW